LKAAKILGTENAKKQTSKSTSTTETSAYPSAENAGKPSQRKTSNGKNMTQIIYNKTLLVSEDFFFEF
jgi:hypothetical protein